MSGRIVWATKSGVIAAAIALAGCSRPPTVETFTIDETVTRPPPSFEATIQTESVVELSFSIAGTVEAITAEVDKPVMSGDVIARLDPAPVQLAIHDAEAALQSAQDALAAKESDIQRLELVDTDLVPADDPEKTQADLYAAKERVEQAQAELVVAQAMIEDTEIVAPFDGVIVGISAEPFNQVGVGETVATAYAWDGLRADFQLLGTTGGAVAVGDAVSIDMPDIKATVDGLITEIAGVATADTGAFAAKATPLELPDAARAGMDAIVMLVEDGPPEVLGVLVPASAIEAGPDGGDSTVFKYDPETSKVSKISVEVTETRDKSVVIGSGLAVGDVVVTGDTSALSDGETVTLVKSGT
ncbi:MAG: efflux RND transporter periplasmic adaptor subunit [Hyphomicrobiales bacterium]|nr:efflux RND transporter periplasmic adaptor subunit [Hyphomicrobiales bacterium]